ncbi:salicylate hydroxylase [Pseudooceanicola antarcticus]|uniref:FAD-dependent monooxygenase n=1 Tax=Pseudooceanicola antarcticus TaxID=1247613 RepID=A0A285HX08_9RHOB|nr:FAD-dependent monooxygenase [Pseudooceanicola antarcticus]PJE27509.1 FAD-dependent monooxygenase [Pseudooceanicola antarcticus]SNY39241.1 salicylate hydroxylase [Pseudooceanicola antarcticus]
MKIAIIGAGVAGSIMARGLADVPGLEVHCLERIAPGEHAESGTGLNIGPNAVQALQQTDPELAQRVAETSFGWRSWRVSTMGGQELMNLKLKDIAPVDGWRLRWAELYRVLREAAGDSIRYSCTIDAVTPKLDGSGRLDIAFTEGGRRKALTDVDLLVAADGRFSQVRTQFRGPVNARQVGVAIFRLLVPDTTGGLIDDYEQWFNGPNRLLGYRVPENSIYMSGTFPIPVGGEIPEEMKTPEALRHAFTPADGQLSDQGRWLVDLVSHPAVELHWARLQESPLCLREEGVNLLYLGDSSNGMVPTLGQGATQAVESTCAAVEIIRALAAAGQHDPALWLQAITRARQDRLRFVMDFSMEASDTLLAGADPVAGTAKKTEAPFQASLARLYNDYGVPEGLLETV